MSRSMVVTVVLIVLALAVAGSLALLFQGGKEDLLEVVRARYEGLSQEQVEQMGYHSEPFCTDSNEVGEPGLGAMGFHAINHDLFENMQPDQPPIMLLDGNGTVMGIEYETEDASGPAPTFFGHQFEFSPPHPGHEVDHWMLHIYFQPDEELISTWNPQLSCPEGDFD